MKHIITILLSVLMVSVPLIAQAQSNNNYSLKYKPAEYLQSGYISYINDPDKDINLEEGYVYEHPLRRFEITFIISLPFVFILTFVSLHMFDVIREKDPNVNVWKDYRPYLLAGTFSISSIIAFREAWITMKINRERKEGDKHGIKERAIFLYANKRF